MGKEELQLGRRDFMKTLGAGLMVLGVPKHLHELAMEQPEQFCYEGGSVEEQGRVLVETIRGLSRVQAELWRQVPAWALEADMRKGYSGLLHDAYTHKMWHIGELVSPSKGMNGLSVDLTNGELGYKFGRNERGELMPVSDETVLGLVFEMELVDADGVLEYLRNCAHTPYWGYTKTTGEWVQTFDPADLEPKKAAIRERLGLERPEEMRGRSV